MGATATHFKGYWVTSDWHWDDVSEKVQQTISYQPIQILMVSTPTHILLQINPQENTYDTVKDIENLAYSAESFAYLGRTLRNSSSPESEFVKKFAGNPAFSRLNTDAPFCELAVDIAYFAEILHFAHQMFIKESSESETSGGSFLFVQKILSMDWVKISGLMDAKTFYAATDFTSRGIELYAGIEGEFTPTSPNNLLKIYLEPAENGVQLPTWVPSDAQSFGSTSLNIRKAYDYLQEQLTLQTGNAWTTFIAMQEPLIRQITGFGIQDYFHSFGSNLYTFSFNPQKKEDTSDEDDSPPFVPQAFILTLKNSAPIHSLIQHFVVANGVNITPQQRQGFTVWNFSEESEMITLLYNNEYLIVSNTEPITEQLIHQISRSETSPSAFFQRDDIRSLLKEVDISTLSSLNIASRMNSSQLYEGIWEDLKGEIEDILPLDLLSFRIALYLLKSALTDATTADMGAGINFGSLVQSGYLMHSIQLPDSRSE
jgi:hypothetical protein